MANITVANAQQLVSALSSAQSGDTILLSPGDYGSVTLKNLNFTAPVTIVSADPANQAQFDSLSLVRVNNLTFKSLEVEFVRGDQPRFAPAINTTGSSHLTFDDLYVHGTLDGNAGNDGYGISVFGGSHITVVNSEFEQLYRGVKMSQATDVVVSNNEFHDIRDIATTFAQIQRIEIDGNRIHDIHWEAPEHPDAIQFLTSGTTASSTDIRITNNVIMNGDGNGMQGIFLRDETNVLPYKNVYIGNNLVYITGLYNGIAVGHGENIQIVNNTVLSPNSDAVNTRIMLTDVTGALVAGNVAELLLQSNNTDVTVADNFFINRDPARWALFPNVNAIGDVTVEDLLLAGYGYQPAGGPTEDVSAPTANPGMTLAGTGGVDTLTGGAEADTLDGLDGNDVLNGMTGADRMTGGAGNDIYHVDDAGDVVIDAANGGFDSVHSTISYTLPAEVERLYLDGSANLDGAGNAMSNILCGNGGANTLAGLAGNDKLYGQGGADRLEGGDGNDLLWGGAGADTLVGGAGADSFDWDSAAEAGLGAGRDSVLDFVRGSDKLDLSGIDAIAGTSGNDAFRFIGSAAFSGAAGELHAVSVSGGLLVQGDTNGDSVADFELLLGGLTTPLQSADFVL